MDNIYYLCYYYYLWYI